MANNKLTTSERLIEIGKALGGIAAVLFAAMDARVRPYIAEAMEFVESVGIRGGRLVRQIVDRHLVAMFLRPLLIGSTLAVTIAYLLGIYWTDAVGVGFTELHGFGWMAGIAGIATLVPVVVIGLVWNVRGVRDAGIRLVRRTLEANALGASTTAAGNIRQAIENSIQLATTNLAAPGLTAPVVDTLTTALGTLRFLEVDATEIERLLGSGQSALALTRLTDMEARVTASLQGIVAHLGTPAVQADQDARLASLAFQTDLVRLQNDLRTLRTQITNAVQNIRNTLATTIQERFGRPGYAPHITVILILQWVVACAWFVALGVILRSAHLGEMDVDTRWTSGFIAMAVINGFVAFGWLALAIGVATAALKYGLRLITWAVRLVAKPAVEVFDFEDEDDELRVEKDLGLPIEQWSKALASALGTPIGVYGGFMALLLTGHSIEQFAFIVMDALVLLLGYLFLVKMAGIKNEWIYRGVIIFHFVWMVTQFLIWAFRPSLGMNDAGEIGFAAFLFANLVTPTFVVVMMAITGVLGWFATKADGTVRRLLMVAATAMAILTGGTLLARTAFAVPPTVSTSTSIDADDHNGLGSLIPEHTANAGSHDASRRATCSSTGDHTAHCDAP